MSNLTSGSRPRPYGKGGRVVVLPMKASAQVWESAMVAEISGAVCTGTTAGAGRCIGVAEHDQKGGASDGTTRLRVMTDQIFRIKVGSNAPTDATPYGTALFMETDNTVGTGGTGGTGEGYAGQFMGLENDPTWCRVFIGTLADDATIPVNVAATDSASQTINRAGRVTRVNVPAVISQNTSITLGTTGAVIGDIMRVCSPGTSAHTVAVINGGTGAGTLNTVGSGKVGYVQAYFDGTNWIYDGSSVA